MQTLYRNHSCAIAAAALCWTALPQAAEASFARQIGSSYGGRLSTSGSTSTQQLTSDPASILQGSVSTTYQPDLVTLVELLPAEFFQVSALIGVRLPTDPATTERFVTDAAFFAGGLPAGTVETGYVQIAFLRTGGFETESNVPTREGFTNEVTNGEINGDETHALFFQAVNPPSSEVASYTLYQEDGTRHAVVPDYLVMLNEQRVDTPSSSATVSAPLPEPSAALLAVAAAGGALLRRRRRSK